MSDVDYPAQDFRPSARLRLIVRFDEFGDKAKLAATAPKRIVKNLNGVRDKAGELQVVPDPDAPPGVQRLLLKAKGKSPGGPHDQVASSDGLTHVLEGIVPFEAQHKQNGVRAGDALTATIKFIDCPIDPRVIRACAVEYYLGCVPDEEALAAGDGKGTPPDLVPDGYVDEDGRQRSNRRFQGWVDKWSVEWTDSAEPRIHLECRDNTKLLIDQDMPPKAALDQKLPLDEAVADFLAMFPQLHGLSVEYRGNSIIARGVPLADVPPKLSEVLARTAFRPNLGPTPSKGAGAGGKHSVWDYLTDVCGTVAHTIRVEGSVVVIQRLRHLMGGPVATRGDDPFQGRVHNGSRTPYRRFIYGRNVLEMKMARDLSKNVPQNVEVRSYNSEDKAVLVARFPGKDDRLTHALPGDAGTEQKWHVVRVSGINDPKTLRAIGQETYEALGRSELQCDIRTKNIASFGGGAADPDLLDMTPGDTIEVLTARDDDQEWSTVGKIETSLLAMERCAELMGVLGFSPEFSQAYAKAYTDSGFQTTFRVRNVMTDWHVDEGVSVSVSAVNYIEVRADAVDDAG